MWPNSPSRTVLSCERSYPTACAAGPPVDRQAGQQPMASATKRWRKGLAHPACPRSCFLCVPPGGVPGVFGGDIFLRRLLKRRWSHWDIRTRGLLQLSERQAEYVRRVSSMLWTDECALPKIGQDINPPLACRQGVAVLTSGRGSGGGRGGPVTAAREGRHHRHRGYL
ncbi:hypothetical protein TcCL_Unassigned05443 [Trypanosoma cruzi]|nr:hypothetical protein TcCL_Unassigned05443 [Trypanosoma cruzi]